MIRTEVDGVPTLFAPVPGPLRAGLVFRVGEADEPLPQRGMTHLVEHLALHRHGITDYHFNGATGAITTSFHVKGGEDEAVSFFAEVCSSLASLPLDRLGTEKAILRTEAAGRGRSVFAELPAWRHGARDHGATAYPEYGLHAATEDSTAAWAAHWFTRQNAVLWIAGERLPPGLRLWLREGYHQPVPRPSAILPPVPSYVTGPCIAYSAHVPESTAAWMFSRFLERQLFRALRQDSGLSYQAAASYTEYGDGSAAIEAGAVALAETRDAVLGGFLDVLGRIRAGHIDPADTAAVAAQAIEAYRDPATQAGRLSVAALRLLTGREPVPAEQVVAQLASVTPADLHAVAAQAAPSGLLMVPPGRSADWTGFVPAPVASGPPVAGRTFRERGEKGRYVLAADGMSWTCGDSARTVRFAAAAAVLAWPDGRRTLIGSNGTEITIEPTLVKIPPAGLTRIDAAAGRLLVWMPARRPDQIPRPRTAAQRRAARPRRGPLGVRRRGILAIGFLVFMAALAVLLKVSPDLWAAVVAGLIFLGGPVLLVVGAVLGIQWLRGR